MGEVFPGKHLQAHEKLYILYFRPQQHGLLGINKSCLAEIAEKKKATYINIQLYMIAMRAAHYGSNAATSTKHANVKQTDKD